MKLTPVTRLRPSVAGTDAYGNPIYTESSSSLPPALFAPGGTSEPTVTGQAPVVSEPTLYWRGEWPDVTEHDRLTVRGRTYEVEGAPADWRADAVAQGGLVITLRRAG